MNIGAAIMANRIMKNMSQTELANSANMSTSYVSLIENGKRAVNLSVLQNIANALDMSLIELALSTDDLSWADKELIGYIADCAVNKLRK